jgi:ketol-acid reductoisomerase
MKRKKTDKSAPAHLKGKRLAVLGYGSQGRAQALNLRDSGFDPVIGLPPESESIQKARKDGFTVVSPHDAVIQSDVIAVLIADHLQKGFFDSIETPAELSGRALIFAHGLSIAFGLVRPPADCDIILVAPHGPGLRLREKYEKGEPFTAFIAVGNDHTGVASDIAAAYAEAIGCPESARFPSTFEEEAVGDIFGEQAVLCGGLVGLMESGFNTLVEKGHSAQSAYLECIYQLDLIVDLVKKYGPAGMFERISKTAAFGSLREKDSLFGSGFSKKLDDLYEEIKTGGFARKLEDESRSGMSEYRKLLKEIRQSTLQKTHEILSERLKTRDL